MKQLTTQEQSRALMDAGFPMETYWNEKHQERRVLPVEIHDLLEMLPLEIYINEVGDYADLGFYRESHCNPSVWVTHYSNPMYVNAGHQTKSEELIDALVEMALWVAEKGYKNNK